MNIKVISYLYPDSIRNFFAGLLLVLLVGCQTNHKKSDSSVPDLPYPVLGCYPKDFVFYKNLEYVSIYYDIDPRYSNFVHIDSFCYLKNLKSLHFAGINLRSLDSIFYYTKDLDSLKRFSCVSCGIQCLSSNIFFPKKIKELELNYNIIDTINDNIRNLKELKDISLANNRLSSLPLSIGELDKLEDLDLSGNQFKTFPIGLCNLKNLRKIDLSENKLQTLPDSMWQMEKLESIYLWGNPPLHVPQALHALSKAPKLNHLDLSVIKMDSLDKNIGLLNQLKSLTLYENDLSYIPQDIMKLTQLKYLNLMKNSKLFKDSTHIKRMLPHCEIRFD